MWRTVRSTWLIAAIFIALASFGCQPGEGFTMEESDYLRELHELDPDDPEAVERLVERLTEDARRLPRRSVQLWAAGEPNEQRNATEIVFELGELVIDAALNEQEALQNPQKLQLLSLAVEEQLELRGRLIFALSGLLEEKAPLPMPQPPSDLEEEEEPQERRICDQAYLLLRRLLNMEENEDNHAIASNDFLELEERERDAEIQKAIKSKSWTVWYEEDTE